MKLKSFIFIAFLFITITASAQLTTGVWRGVLTSESGNELPFNFQVKDVTGGQHIVIINGDERFKVTDVKAVGDSVFIHMPLFDSEFRLKKEHGKLTGFWVRHLADGESAMPFTAGHGSYRFFKNAPQPAFNITGRYTAMFGDGKKQREALVGEFKQVGAKLTGTFLSTTGDYRYLEGTVAGNKLYLSCFDGGHAYVFTATIKDKNTLIDGKQYSGVKGMDVWSAYRNANAKLPDAYSLTSLKNGDKKIAFTFRDINGNNVSLSDNRFKNKVVIVQIMGSWCPNCMDETNYLVSDYYPKYHAKGVEIIGLSYERTTDFEKSQHSLSQIKTRFNVPYPLLITGYTPVKGDPEKSLPELADFKGFPTTIIIDKKGDVRKIHTGFNGPGTGIYYTEFKDEFQKLTDELLAEN